MQEVENIYDYRNDGKSSGTGGSGGYGRGKKVSA